MQRGRHAISYDDLVSFQCADGYLTASGLEGERLFLRAPRLSASQEALPFFSFDHSVFQIVPAQGIAAAATAKQVAQKGSTTTAEAEPTETGSPKELCYGYSFSLVHVASQLIVSMAHSKPSENDPDCISVVLVRPEAAVASGSEFIFVSRYKIRSNGDKVCRSDDVLLRLSSKVVFFHVSAPSWLTAPEADPTAMNLVRLTFRGHPPAAPPATEILSSPSLDGSAVFSEAEVPEERAAAAGCPLALTALARPYLDEVSGCEESGMAFTIGRYDAGRERATQQQAELHLSRPFIPAGEPIALYHREREAFLTSSLSRTSPPPASSDASPRLPASVMEEAAAGGGGWGGSPQTAVTEGGGGWGGPGQDAATGMPYPVFTSLRCRFSESTDVALVDTNFSCTELWIIEKEDPTVGGPVRLGADLYRLRHAASGLYMAVCGTSVDTCFEHAEEDRGFFSGVNSFASAGGAPREGGEIAPERMPPPPPASAASRSGRAGGATTAATSVRATVLGLLPAPTNPAELRRTLFSIESVFATECAWLMEQESLVLRNELTGMYLYTEPSLTGSHVRYGLQWLPSVADTIVATRVHRELRRDTLFLHSQCLSLGRFRAALQAAGRDHAEAQAAPIAGSSSGDGAAAAATEAAAHRQAVAALVQARLQATEEDDDQAVLSRSGGYDFRFDGCEGDPAAVHPAYRSLGPLLRGGQRALSALIRFCTDSSETNPLRREGLPRRAHQVMLYDVHLHRLVVEVLVAAFAVLPRGGPRGPALGGVSPAGRSHGHLLQVLLLPPGETALWDGRDELPSLPLEGGLVELAEVLLPTHGELHVFCRLALRLLRQMVRHDSALAAGWEGYVPYLLALDGQRLAVVETLKEMFSNNPSLSLPTTLQVTEHFVAAAHCRRRVLYLEFLGVACTLHDRGIAERQELICRKVLLESPDLLCRFFVQEGQLCVSGRGFPAAVPLSAFLATHAETEAGRFAVTQVAFLARLCFDGCPPMCREEVARVFTHEAMLLALRGIVRTGAESVGRSNPRDILSAHLLRLALQVFLVPRLTDPAVQLRVGTVLFGSSELRVRDSAYFSGQTDDAMGRVVKEVTMRILRANPYFVQKDLGRSVLMRTVLEIWLRLVCARQYTAADLRDLLPILLGLLDGRQDVLGETSAPFVAPSSATRWTSCESGLHLIRVRAVVCLVLHAALDNDIFHGADEIIVGLYHRYTGLPAASASAPGGGGGKAAGSRPRERRLFASLTTTAKTPLLSGQVVTRYDAAAHHLTGTDETKEAAVEFVTSLVGVVERRLAEAYCPSRLVPLLVEVTRYGHTLLTLEATRLLVKLCVVRRVLARHVLTVNTMPSLEVLRGFDGMYHLAIQLQRGYAASASFSAAWTTSIGEILETLLRHAPGEPEHGTPPPAAAAAAAATPTPTATAGTATSTGATTTTTTTTTTPPTATTPITTTTTTATTAAEKIRRAWSRSKHMWGKTSGVTRVLMYGGAIRERRRAIGMSEHSGFPLHLLIRAEMMCHWRIHETLLEMLPQIPPTDRAFATLMRIFYLFTLSESNAIALRPRLDVFLQVVQHAEGEATLLCLHVIVSILGTLRDVNEYLTSEFLHSLVRCIDVEVAASVPDDSFVELLSLEIFSKDNVSALVRRRMMLILREHHTLDGLCAPKLHPSMTDIIFTSSLVNLVCNVCGSHASVLTLAQRMLPPQDLCNVVLRYYKNDSRQFSYYATSAGPAMGEASASPAERTSIKLINPYIRALVVLYLTTAEEDAEELMRHQVEWTSNPNWWSIVRLIISILTQTSEQIEVGAGRIDNGGLGAIEDFRMLHLTTIPTAIAAFFTNCFNVEAYRRLRATLIQNTLEQLGGVCVRFGWHLLTHATTLHLTVEEMVGYRRMLGSFQFCLRRIDLPNLIELANAAEPCKQALREWLLVQQRAIEQQLLEEERQWTTGGGGALGTARGERSAIDALFTEVAASQELQRQPWDAVVTDDSGKPHGLLESSVVAHQKWIKAVRGRLQAMLQGHAVVPEAEVKGGSADDVFHRLLLQTVHKAAVRDGVRRISDAMRQHLLPPSVAVGLLDCFCSALEMAGGGGRPESGPPPVASPPSPVPEGLSGTDAALRGHALRHRLQTTFTELGLMHVVTSLCTAEDDVITYSAMRLGVALLEGGNRRVQRSLMTYFETREEGFFHHMRQLLQRSTARVAQLNTQHQAYLLRSGMSGSEAKLAATSLNTQLVEAMMPRRAGPRGGTPSSLPPSASSGTSIHGLTGWASARGSRDLEMVGLLLRLLQLFCEGHYAGMQNYIRTQHDNLHSANMIHEAIVFVTEASRFITSANIRVVRRCFDLLTEVCQGPCHTNQEALITYDVGGVVRRVLEYMDRTGIGCDFDPPAEAPRPLEADASVSLMMDASATTTTTTTMTAAAATATAAAAPSPLPPAVTTVGSEPGGRPSRDLINTPHPTDLSGLRLALSTTMLSLLEGGRDRTAYERITVQLPFAVLEREMTSLSALVSRRAIPEEGYQDDPTVDALFNWLIFLNSILPFAREEAHGDIMGILSRYHALSQYLGSIEVSRADGLERVYFRIPHICTGLRPASKSQLLWTVDRTSRATKLADFLHKSDELIFAIEGAYTFQRQVRQRTRFSVAAVPGTGVWSGAVRCIKQGYNRHIAPLLFSHRVIYYDIISVVLALIVNVVLILIEGATFIRMDYLRQEKTAISVVCALQVVVSAILLFMDVALGFPVRLYVLHKERERFAVGKARLNVRMQEVYAALPLRERVRSLCTWFVVQFRIFLLLAAILSWWVSPYFAAFNLTLLIYKIPTLRTFIAAITMNGKQLALTSFLGAILVYLFSIIGFLLFSTEFGDAPEEGESGGQVAYCTSLMHCFVYILSNGLRAGGGVGDAMQPWAWGAPRLTARVTYEILFYALINVVFLNILFGIIIDTFGQMRDEKRERELDMYGYCFICGLNANTLEKTSTSGFQRHVKEEHNMWMYLYFMHHLRCKDPSEYTGQESYVNTMIQLSSLDFFPDENCLSLVESKRTGRGESSSSSDEDEDEVRRRSLGEGGTGGSGGKGEGKSAAAHEAAMAQTQRELTGLKEMFSKYVQEIGTNSGHIKAALQQVELSARGITHMGSPRSNDRASAISNTFLRSAPTQVPSSTMESTASYQADNRRTAVPDRRREVDTELTGERSMPFSGTYGPREGRDVGDSSGRSARATEQQLVRLRAELTRLRVDNTAKESALTQQSVEIARLMERLGDKATGPPRTKSPH